MSEVKANKMMASGTSAVKAATLPTTTLSGKGRLTRDRMKKWSSYYRKAIVENATDAAHHAVWAIFFHSLSTLDDPHHSFCSDTWCYWLQAQLEGVDPAIKLKQMKHDTPLPRDVSERLIPLFEHLANPDLLSRCMKLVTSNANESLHSTVWRRAPKEKYCGKKTTEIAVALAVMSYNKGAGALSDAISSLGVSPGKTLLRVTAQLDALRLRVADKVAQTATKTSRKRRAMQKLQHDIKMVASEGVVYDAGGHWPFELNFVCYFVLRILANPTLSILLFYILLLLLFIITFLNLYIIPC